MNFDMLDHYDYELWKAVEDLYYYLMTGEDDEYTELNLGSDIEVMLENACHVK